MPHYKLKGYGFNLITYYFMWIGLVRILSSFCKWLDGYKRNNQSAKWWLSYLQKFNLTGHFR